MNESKLILVLGDQLSLNQPALKQSEPGRDVIVLAEVTEEATYVRHNRHKIALLFAAMRHFRLELEALGHNVHYTAIDEGVASLEEAVRNVLVQTAATEVVVCEPGEYRLVHQMRSAWSSSLSVPVQSLKTTDFWRPMTISSSGLAVKSSFAWSSFIARCASATSC